MIECCTCWRQITRCKYPASNDTRTSVVCKGQCELDTASLVSHYMSRMLWYNRNSIYGTLSRRDNMKRFMLPVAWFADEILEAFFVWFILSELAHLIYPCIVPMNLVQDIVTIASNTVSNDHWGDHWGLQLYAQGKTMDNTESGHQLQLQSAIPCDKETGFDVSCCFHKIDRIFVWIMFMVGVILTELFAWQAPQRVRWC